MVRVFPLLRCAVYDRDGRPAVDHAIQRGLVVAYLWIVLSVVQDHKADVLLLRSSGRFWPTADGQTTWAGARPMKGSNRPVSVNRAYKASGCFAVFLLTAVYVHLDHQRGKPGACIFTFITTRNGNIATLNRGEFLPG